MLKHEKGGVLWQKKALDNSGVLLKQENNRWHLFIHVPIRFSLPITKANTRFLYIFLCMLRLHDGTPLISYQAIAIMFGFANRQNINNYWREFVGYGQDMLDYLSRRVMLSEAVPLIQDIVIKNILLPMQMQYRLFCDTHTLKMSYVTFSKYAGMIEPLAVIKAARDLFKNNGNQTDTLHLLELISNQHRRPVICDHLLELAKNKKEAQQTKDRGFYQLSRQNLCLLVNFLVGSGLNLSIIGMLLNVSKATVHNLWHEIYDLQSLILNSIAKWSGKISIDEKYVKIKGVPHYVISIVDFVTGLPLYLDVFPDTKTASFQSCFLMFKMLYGSPRLIVSDGSRSLAEARKLVFPNVHYQLCKFHKIRNLLKQLYKCYLPPEKQNRYKKLILKAFARKTVSGRKKGMTIAKASIPAPAARYIEHNILSNWRHLCKGLTSNISERWNRKIKKVTQGRYGLKSVKTTRRLVYSLWVKELILKGKPYLHEQSVLANLSITQICQENLEWKHMERLFSTHVDKAA